MTEDVDWLTREAAARELHVSAGYIAALARQNHWRKRRDRGRAYFYAPDVREPRGRARRRPLGTPTERLAGKVTTYRLTIELARTALRTGRIDEAQTILDEAVE